jgi:pimeloyl-ACP methyl ester carboxylesterase
MGEARILGNEYRVKKFVRPLAAGAGLTGALAVFNRSVSNGPEPASALGGTVRRWNWRGHGIFSTESGTGPLIVLVHSVHPGASSYEYRKLFPLLAANHRVVAFDLLGCGLSDRPNLGYSADLFTELVIDALAEAGSTRPVTIVGSGLGAAFAIRAAARSAQPVSSVVAICPTGLGGVFDRPPNGAQTALTGTVRTPVLGEALFNGFASRPSIRYFLGHRTYADAASATPEVVDHLYAVAHQPGARYVPAHFVGGMLNCNIALDLPFVTAPILLAWGEHASSFSPLANAGEFLKLAQNAKLVTFAHSGLMPHEEEPAAMCAAIDDFLVPVRPG